MQRVRTIVNAVTAFAGTVTARRIIIGLFVAQALLLAFITRVGVPPDEENHLNFIRYYANNSLSPVIENQEPTWNLGDKTREVDYLYHYGASFIARLLPGENLEIYVLRILSVVVAAITLILLVRLLKRLGVSNAPIAIGIAVITNLPMVLMVSAAVNNDVFVWLGYVLGLLLLCRLWQKPALLDLILLANVSIAGGLIKRTLLPVGVLFMAVGVISMIRRWSAFIKSLKLNWRLIAAAAVLLVFTGLFIERVGGNLLQYGKIAPACDEVQGEEKCSIFWASSRERWLKAGAPAEENIWLPAESLQIDKNLSLPVFGAMWLNDSVANIVDIQTQGWWHEVEPPVWLAPLLLIIMTAAIIYGVGSDIVKFYRSRQRTYGMRIFVVVTAVFIMIIHLLVNYSSYSKFSVYGLALNGRYILPALLVLIPLGAYYASRALPRPVIQLLAAIVLGLLVVCSGLILMLRNGQLVAG